MLKLISIAAIAVGALLAALPRGGMRVPVNLSEQPAIAACIPQQRHLTLAAEFHARLFLKASRKLDAAATQDYGDATDGEFIALAGQPTCGGSAR